MRELAFADIGPLMMMLLPAAATYARVPVSNFRVGAVAAGLSREGEVPNFYLGSNVEFLGHALSFTVHAEQSATNNAWLQGEQGMTALAMSAAPCGYCRQFLYETADPWALDILLPIKGTFTPQVNPLGFFIPEAFGPQDLNKEASLMQYEDHGLHVSSADPLVQAALQAANASYAPYTGNFAGVALETHGGAVYAGRHAENAAYNPSLSPFQSAIAGFNMSIASGSSLNITRAVLLEAPARVSQRSATEALLASVSPDCRLEYHLATRTMAPRG
jgi:cytidine deaminase